MPAVASPRYAAELVISDAVVLSFSARGDLLKEFPFLRFKVPIAARGQCGGCKRRSADRAGSIQEYARIRSALVGLASDSLGRFKSLLKVAKLVVYTNQQGKVKKHVI